MRKPVVHLYTVCWDEADMLGFFFRHYDRFVDRYVVYDDGSTDGSREILAAHPKVELRRFDRVETESFVLSHKAMQDEAWKESRGRADWIVVTAIDEHLHLPGRDIAAYLAGMSARGVTMIPALGFDMNHPVMPADRGLLVDAVTTGRARSGFNKLSVFDPGALRETGFGPGRHVAEPAGDLVLPARDELLLWHYKHLGFERNAAREAAQARRLGNVDVQRGFGQHYLWSAERLRAFWDEMERTSSDLAAPGFSAGEACVRPLWWEDRAIPRAVAAPLPGLRPAPADAAPTVSVLIKTYNHGPYLRQAIESVLAQSFQDFEIVVTDDASTDDTPAILRRFDDPRIRVERFERNRGISAAMNATIARARGRYLAILNSDDWALPGRLARQVAFLAENRQVSAVFGQPRLVNESGLPSDPFDVFGTPLGFPDFSRRNWLRFFFFAGNCLCAPTAMIRREAYEEVGAYDERLTNLQDFDMWIRMLIAGHGIQVLPDELSAFRIRAGHANMSAPKIETHLRSVYETSKILRHFSALDRDLFMEVFGDEPEAAEAEDGTIPLRVAEIALRTGRVDYQAFALDWLYETARTREDFDRLRAWAGETDVFHLAAVGRLNREARDREAAISRLGEALSRKEDEVAVLTDEVNKAEAEVAVLAHEFDKASATAQELHTHLDATLASRERMRNSLSWRSTAFLRWVGRRGASLRRTPSSG